VRSTQTWTNRLENHAGHIIGNKPVSDITKDDIQNILLPLWLEKNETALRVRMYIFDILEYAADKDYTTNSNPASTRIYKLLPEFTGQVKHWPALHHDKAVAFFDELGARNNDSAKALQMIMLTAQREIDVRNCAMGSDRFRCPSLARADCQAHKEEVGLHFGRAAAGPALQNAG